KNGDRGGLADIEAALRLGLDRGFGNATTVTYINYADCVWFEEGPERGLEVHRTGQEFGARRGASGIVFWSRGETVWMLFDLGRWDEPPGDLRSSAGGGRGHQPGDDDGELVPRVRAGPPGTIG